MRTAASYYNNTIKPPRDFFMWCESKFDNYSWRYKKEIVHSNKNFKHRPRHDPIGIRKISTVTRKSRSEIFLFRDVNNGRIESQLWKYEQTFSGLKETLTKYLLNLEIYENHTHIKVHRDNHKNRTYFGLGYASGDHYSSMNNTFYTGAHMYRNEWRDKLKLDTDFKYFPMDLIHPKIHPSGLEHLYRYRKEIEYCRNIKATEIEKSITSHNGADMRVVNLKWLIKNKQSIKHSETSFYELNFKNKIEERNGKVVDGIHDIIETKHIKFIPKEIGMIKWQNWAIKNDIDIALYIDYLHLLKDLSINDKSTGTLIPTDLVVAHDKAVDLLNSIKKEIDEKLMSKVINDTKEFEYKTDSLMVLAPKSLKEIIQEGKSLKHCVGSSLYVDGHRERKTTILFIRDTKLPNNPLYTLEFKQGKIVQCRGLRNARASEEVSLFLEDWKKHLVTDTRVRTSA